MNSDPAASNSASNTSNASIDAYHQATVCNVCYKEFSKPFVLGRHRRSIHEQSTKIFCNVEGCGQQFCGLDVRDRHVVAVHGSSKQKCPHCGAYVRKDALGQHMASRSCLKRGAVIAQQTGIPQLQQPRSLRPLAPAEHDEIKGGTVSEQLEQVPQCLSTTRANVLDCGHPSSASED